MASTTTSQATNFNYCWNMCGSEENPGFTSSSATNSNVNQSLSNCQQTSIDYGHSPYSASSSGYPMPYYHTGSTGAIGSATSTALYQQLASHFPATAPSMSLLGWDSSEEEFKTKISKKNHHYISDSNAHYHPLDSNSVNGKQAIELLSSHTSASTKKSSMNSSSQSQVANFNCYGWPAHGSEDNSGFNLSATNSSTVNSNGASCSQASLDYPYPYSQTNQWYPVGFNYQPYNATNASSIYQLAAHIPPTSTTVNQLLNWDQEQEQEGKAKSSKKHCNHYASEGNSFHHSSLDNSASTTPKPSNELITSHPNSSSTAAKKGTNKSGRGRGRRQQTQSPDPENSLERAFIWDLDETIIIFNQLIQGKFVSEKAETLQSLGLMMERMCVMEGELHFFLNDLENCDQIHIDDVFSDDNGQDLSNYDFGADGFNQATKNCNMGLPAVGSRNGVDWMRKLAFRYRRIKELYNQYRSNMAALMGSKYQDWRALRRQIEASTSNWLSCALMCLDIIHKRANCVNILVTDSGLVPSLVKILLHDLGPYFPIENVYSASKVGKETCFQKIKERFGSKCTYVVIGDGETEELASKALGMPFWKLESYAALVNLHSVLNQDLF
ncbi:eya transcriptional coactivator and phosphatase 2 isoform X2 [Brevipalpus obovatus]|uniref:eya transcriptional coactivator and phosphatase 2 isoform X2 n=1 Tax=Brevipalpus obovatus TaxID=246614 RepID=UPI003D9FA252